MAYAKKKNKTKRSNKSVKTENKKTAISAQTAKKMLDKMFREWRDSK